MDISQEESVNIIFSENFSNWTFPIPKQQTLHVFTPRSSSPPMLCHFETSFFALSVLCFVLRVSLAEKRKPNPTPTAAEHIRNDYTAFRRNWLSVYYLIMAGDWLQGIPLLKYPTPCTKEGQSLLAS